MATLSLVIPAYNEEARLPALLETLASTADAAVSDAGLDLLEILMVDDGSRDGTQEMLREAQSSNPKLTAVLGSGENRGKGAAIAAGVHRAKGQYVLLADVDLSTPLGELPKLTHALSGGADIAIGSRGIEGATVERGPAHRKLTGRVFSSTVRMLTGLEVRDTQNGFKLLPSEEARGLFADQICAGFAFDVELLVRADMAGLQTVEVPVLYIHDSRSRVRVTQASLHMLREVVELVRELRPRSNARTERRLWRRRSLAELPADDSD